MDNNKVIEALNALALTLDKCSDDVPYEISARNNLYFRMTDAAKEARVLIRDLKEQ